MNSRASFQKELRRRVNLPGAVALPTDHSHLRCHERIVTLFDIDAALRNGKVMTDPEDSRPDHPPGYKAQVWWTNVDDEELCVVVAMPKSEDLMITVTVWWRNP